MRHHLLRDLLVSSLFLGTFLGSSSLFAGKTKPSRKSSSSQKQQVTEEMKENARNVTNLVHACIRDKISSLLIEIVNCIADPKNNRPPELLLRAFRGNGELFKSTIRNPYTKTCVIKVIAKSPAISLTQIANGIQDIANSLPNEQRLEMLDFIKECIDKRGARVPRKLSDSLSSQGSCEDIGVEDIGVDNDDDEA